MTQGVNENNRSVADIGTHEGANSSDKIRQVAALKPPVEAPLRTKSRIHLKTSLHLKRVAFPPSAVRVLLLEAVQWRCASRTVVVNPEQRNPQRQAC